MHSQIFRNHKKISCALYCTRVRFAPSPTGQLHVGGLKTALINYLFAKSSGGKLIFRLEDTDRARYDYKSVENIIKSLSWLGINFDEGIRFGKIDDYYCQSNRLVHYHAAADKLIENGKAYRCFCSEDRLTFMKKEQHRRGETSGYDRRCSRLTSKQVSENLQQGLNSVIRLRTNECGEMKFEDSVFGRVCIPGVSVDCDPIIIKTDKYPVYHLANVVDDHLMDITHVIRGQEWIVSTPKHLLLYQAFGWQPPQFAHLPLIMKDDGHKVSKRDPDFQESHYNIGYLIDKGYSPETVMSWLMSCGSGLSCEWHPNITLSEIIEHFSLAKISTHDASLSKSLLQVVGRSKLSSLTLSRPYFDNVVLSYMNQHNIKTSFEQFQRYFEQLKHRTACLHDFLEFSYLWSFQPIGIEDLTPVIKVTTGSEKEAVRQLLGRLLTLVKSENGVGDELEELSRGICSKSSAMKCIRKVLTNQMDGPKVKELIELFSKDEIIKRINCTLK